VEALILNLVSFKNHAALWFGCDSCAALKSVQSRDLMLMLEPFLIAGFGNKYF
jgi:hypothetical protein